MTSSDAFEAGKRAHALSVTAGAAYLLTHPDTEEMTTLAAYYADHIARGIIEPTSRPTANARHFSHENITDVVGFIGLATLNNAAPCYMSTITKATGIERTIVSRTVSALTSQGFLTESLLKKRHNGRLLEPTLKLAAGLMTLGPWQDAVQADYVAEHHGVDRAGAKRLAIMRELQTLALSDSGEAQSRSAIRH